MVYHLLYAEFALLFARGAEVIVDGQVAPEFEVCNGLRQGCVIAPTLFNLVISQWREKCGDFGVDILYRCGGKLGLEDLVTSG